MDLAELQQLLDAEWLEDEYKEILKEVMRRTIKLMPSMIDILENQLKDN